MNPDYRVTDDSVQFYLATVSENVPPLTRSEESACIQHVRAGDQHAESAGLRLVEANLHLVVTIAERYQNDRIHILELIQKGNDGLLDALRSFAASDEQSFSAHAAPYVERAIAAALAS